MERCENSPKRGTIYESGTLSRDGLSPTFQGLPPRVCLTFRPKGQIAVADMSAASITPLFRLCDLHLGLTSCDDVRAARDGCSVRGNMI